MKMKKKSIQMISFSLFIFMFLSLNSFFSKQMAMAKQINATIPVTIKVGVILDMETSVGTMGLSAIQMALTDFYSSHAHYKTRLVLHIHDSEKDVVTAAAAALDLFKHDEVQAILGPQSSMQANFIIALGDKARVPVISFSATSPVLSSIRSPYFFRTTPNDASQVKAISATIQAFGWRQAVPIYVDNEFGEGIIPFLSDALDEINCRMPYRSVIPPLATDDQIVSELYKLMTMQSRVFIVHMAPSLASRLFVKAKEHGMLTEGYVWIITDSLTSGLDYMDRSVVESMSGVIGVQPYIPGSKQLNEFAIRWKKQFQEDNPTVLNPKLNSYTLWAYDSATALAMAVEESGSVNSGFDKANASRSSTDLETFRISRNGPKLSRTLMSTSFRGLSGDFRIVNGQLESSSYQIVNVVGTSTTVIGFWTRENGIVKEHHDEYSASRGRVISAIWPGGTTFVPKGWVIPTNGKKLRIGVPVKYGFTEFVKVTRDFSTNRIEVKGYSIDVFEAVMANLLYHVPFEYIPYANPDGTSAGSYNDLIYQVYEGNYDAVVGDVTIVANRSKYVDFTLPYTESGVVMVVPVQHEKGNKALLFLKPLTWGLWVVSFLSFWGIGLVVWHLERKDNDEFKGPFLDQVGLIFWCGFSTVVFANSNRFSFPFGKMISKFRIRRSCLAIDFVGEKIVTNKSRFVLIIWFLVVLILTQSYTASLASMLTIQKLKPTVTDVHELLRSKAYVGYKDSSFVYGLLQHMNFDKTRLVKYKSPEECDELLSKGSGNGGVAAVFDEIPYMKLFLARYCSKYTMVGPTYKTDGFGFVFPIGSPLVPDVSRSILDVTQGERMVKIEKAWLGDKTNGQDSDVPLYYNNLGLDSFWGLFTIAGLASAIAVLCTVKSSGDKRHPSKENVEVKDAVDASSSSRQSLSMSPYSSPRSDCSPSPSFSANTENDLPSPREGRAQEENAINQLG